MSIETDHTIHLSMGPIRQLSTYVVHRHDPFGGLWQIAQHFGVPFEALKKANPELGGQGWKLWGGEVLIIPSARSAAAGTAGAGSTIRTYRPHRFPLPSKNDGQLAGGGKVLALGGLKLGELGSIADFQRKVYQEGTQQILEEAKRMMARGTKERDAARWVVDQRNALKVFVRKMGPKFFQTYAEFRNRRKYGATDPTYEQLADRLRRGRPPRPPLPEAKIDIAIIEGVADTSASFNRAGARLRVAGALTEGAALVLTAMTDSPDSWEPLPVSDDEAVEIERARLRLGIPAEANIDRHGHLKPGFYLQLDPFEVTDAHTEREVSAETEEILWALGVDITYHYEGVTWTVPGDFLGHNQAGRNMQDVAGPVAPAGPYSMPSPPPPGR